MGGQPQEASGAVVCVRGLFRSGTNYTKALLETNYDCRVVYDAFGWKHAPFPILSRRARLRMPEMPVLFIVKNPFHAAQSLFQYAGSQQQNLLSNRCELIEEFVTSPIVMRNSEHPESPDLWFPDFATLWVQTGWNALTAAERHPARHLLRYEDLLAAPEATLQGIAAAIGLQRQAGAFRVPVKKMRNLHEAVHDEGRFYLARDFDRERAMRQDYAGQLPAEVVAHLLDRVPRDLAERLGYGALMDEVARDAAALA